MLVIGIPTYNEVENISKLVAAIDAAADTLGIPIIIINADNNSPDNTSKVFMQTKTKAEKLSIITTERGKGVNMKAILEKLVTLDAAIGCLFIDGDITSFEESWLVGYWNALKDDADYVMPRYQRNYQEGNTTNHFVYPLLGAHIGKAVPRQPIGGDFGVSQRFAQYLLTQIWSDSASQYGVDIFMTLHAIYGPFLVKEIALPKKLHKPSFPKMVKMFEEVATSYYTTIKQLRDTAPRSTIVALEIMDDLTTASPLKASDIEDRIQQAIEIGETVDSVISTKLPTASRTVSAAQWVKVLAEHEAKISDLNPHLIAQSILPWYLLRSTTYLNSVTDPASAEHEINTQFSMLVEDFRKKFPIS